MPSTVKQPVDLEEISQACRKTFGYSPKPFQLAATYEFLQGKDTIVIAPTGAGKSLLFRLPFFSTHNRKTMLLIVTPLKALEVEQVERYVEGSDLCQFGLWLISVDGTGTGMPCL